MLNDYKLLQEKREEKILAIKFEPRRSNKIIDGSYYNQDLINRVKSISGRRWNQEEKYREIHSLRYSFATYLLEGGRFKIYSGTFMSQKLKRRVDMRIKTKNNGNLEGCVCKLFGYEGVICHFHGG